MIESADAVSPGGVVVLDGGLATELERRGARLEGALWSARLLLEDREAIRDVHAAYLEAGADVVTTATYQATPEGLARHGPGASAAEAVLRDAVALARDARDAFWSRGADRAGRARPVVAASIGSYGAFLADGSEYVGRYGLSVRELMAFHRARLDILASAEPDILAFETIPSAPESEALARLLDRWPDARAWLSFSCRDGRHLADGEPIGRAVSRLAGHDGVIAVGVNCTAPVFVAPLLRAAASATDRELVAYPNAGERWDAASRTWRAGAAGAALADLAPEWAEIGARWIGGCCRTTPADIRDLRRALAARGLVGPGPGRGE